MAVRHFDIEAALEAEKELRQLLAPVCGRIEVVGSVRRKRARVGDLDLLVLPSKLTFVDQVISLGFSEYVHVRDIAQSPGQGASQIRLVHVETGVPVDLHIAPSMATWWTRLVVLTGSKKFIDRLQATAWAKFRKLRLEGVQDEKNKVRHPKSERGVFQMLGVKYVGPERRDG